MNNEVTAIISIIIGIILCFCGFKVQKLLITLAWFALGFTLGGLVGGYFIDNQTTLLIIEIIVGLILGGAGYKLEKLALFIAVTYLTFKTVGPFVSGYEKGVELLIEGGISLLVGALSTFFIKPILIVVSSIAGATLIKESIPIFVTLSANTLLIVCVVVAILGIISQLKTN